MNLTRMGFRTGGNGIETWRQFLQQRDIRATKFSGRISLHKIEHVHAVNEFVQVRAGKLAERVIATAFSRSLDHGGGDARDFVIVEESVVDLYGAVRNAYLQRRAQMIRE